MRKLSLAGMFILSMVTAAAAAGGAGFNPGTVVGNVYEGFGVNPRGFGLEQSPQYDRYYGYAPGYADNVPVPHTQRRSRHLPHNP
jgi:hypothetical protein